MAEQAFMEQLAVCKETREKVLQYILERTDPADIKKLSDSPIVYRRRVEILYNDGKVLGNNDPDLAYVVRWKDIYYIIKEGKCNILIYSKDKAKILIGLEIQRYIRKDTNKIRSCCLVLSRAMREKNILLISILLKEGNVGKINNYNYLIEAINLGHIEVLKLLLSSQKISTNPEVLITAIIHNNDEVVKLLLEDEQYDPSVNECFALNLASYISNPVIVKLLLEHRRIKEINDYGNTLIYACGGISKEFMTNYDLPMKKQDTSLEVVNILLSHFNKDLDIAITAKMMYEALIAAAEMRFPKLVERLLLDPRSGSYIRGEKIILSAINKDSSTKENDADLIGTVKILLDGTELDPQNAQIFSAATMLGNIDVTKLLLNNSVLDPSAGLNLAIYTACCFNNGTDIIELLLNDNRVNPTDGGNRALSAAVIHDREEIVKLFLRDTKIASACKNDMLYIACVNGKENIVKLLLAAYEIDPTDRDNIALNAAIQHGHTEIVKLLLEDSRITPDYNNQKALNTAVDNVRVDIVKLLLSYSGVDPSIDNNRNIKNVIANIHKYKKEDNAELLKKYLEIANILIKDFRVACILDINDIINLSDK